MSEYSKKEKEHLFKTLREETIPNMEQVIDNCMYTRKVFCLPKVELSNIVLAYHNNMIMLDKEFAKAGIDFFDNIDCETRFAIENYFQSYILIGKNALSKYFRIISSISPDQAQEFADSYKKPTTMEKIFMGKKYEPKKCILTDSQFIKTTILLNIYKEAYNKIAYFSISEDIVAAILVYKLLSYANSRDITERIDVIDKELQKLGYESIKPLVEVQSRLQELTLKNITNIKSVRIRKIRK